MTPLDIELRAFGPDGETRWSRMRSSPRRLADGSVIWDGVSFDETERKLAEQQVREHETQLAHIMRVTTLGEMALRSPMNSGSRLTPSPITRAVAFVGCKATRGIEMK